MNPLTPVHITDNYLINPTNPVTITLIGAGGTGSNVVMALAKMNHALIALGHTGLQVTLYDDDRVTEANKGRQLFADSEVGLFKAVALINRVNRFFGTNWKAVPQQFNAMVLNSSPNPERSNLYISCVDNVPSRMGIAGILKQFSEMNRYERNRPLYWMDFGNSKHTGQVIISTIKAVEQPESNLYQTVPYLPMVTDEFKDLLEQAETGDDTPSCSLADALAKQDLFINSSLANLGASLLWSLFREGMLFNRGFFLNLKTFRSEPLKVG
jgi:PRTRC genetic system ThiF family protein